MVVAIAGESKFKDDENCKYTTKKLQTFWQKICDDEYSNLQG